MVRRASLFRSYECVAFLSDENTEYIGFTKNMSLSIGIVGLPNVGKSTLFNALLKQNLALAANYPFATIEPNIGIAGVPDERLEPLARLVGTTTIKPATIEFVDVAGLVPGASSGEGLGNKFLSHLKSTNALAHVLRVFTDPDIIRESSLNPLADLQTIRLELQLADLNLLEKQKPPKANLSSTEQARLAHLDQFKKFLNQGSNLTAYFATLDQSDAVVARRLAQELNLLTSKPEIFVLNVDETALIDSEQLIAQWQQTLACPATQIVVVSAKIEAEIGNLDQEEQSLFLTELGLPQSGLARLAQVAYQTLGLQSFLTAGELEVRAWTIPTGATAPLAAGVIHTDFIDKFIKAKVVNYQDFLTYKNWKAASDAGKVRLEGKDYLMQPDDIVEFLLQK